MPTQSAPRKSWYLLPWLPLFASLVNTHANVDMNYGSAYFLLDYRHGFVKRALLGVPFQHMAYLSRGQARLVEIAILLACVLLTYTVFATPLFKDRAVAPLTVILLAGPSLLPHFFFMFIPTDPVLYMVALCCVWAFLRLPRSAAWTLSVVLCSVTLLIHEGFPLMFYPAVVAVLIDLCRRKKLSWLMAGAHVAIVSVAFLSILHFGNIKVDPQVAIAEAVSRAGFRLDPHVFLMMHQTTQEQSAESLGAFLHRGPLQTLLLATLFATPYFVVVGTALRRALRAAAVPAWQTLCCGVLFCSPLLLMIAGYDISRWISDCFICATLFVLYLYSMDAPDGPVRQSLREQAASCNLPFYLGMSLAIGPYAGMANVASAGVLDSYYRR